MVNNAAHMTVQETINALVARGGVTTSDGAAGGTSLIDSNLISPNDWVTGKGVLILNGDNNLEGKIATGFNIATGEVTFDSAMTGQVLAGMPYLILNVANAGAAVIAILAALNVPTPDAITNALERDVIGNKEDVASIVVSDVNSLVAYIKGILNVVNTIAGGAFYHTFGLGNVQVTNAVTFGVTVFDPSGGIIPQANITAGTHTIDRIRLGVLTNIVAATPSSKTDGAVYVNYAFPAISWAIGDVFLVTFSGIQIVISGVTTSLPPIQVWGRVVMEPDIQSQVTTINTNQGDPSGDTLISTTAKLGDLAISLATLLGARWDAGGDLSTDILALLTNLGDPSGHTLTSVVAKMGDLAIDLDTLLGARWDAGGDLGTDIAQLLADTVTLITNLGDPSGDTLTSLSAKWGDIARSLATILGTRWDAAGDLGTDIASLLATQAASLKEQASVAISDIAPIAPLVFNILNLVTANTRYVVRSLRIKTVDPSPNTITVRLYELVNGALTEVDSFVINGTNYGTYHSLMDMFGLPELAGDNLKVTIEASAVGYATLAQYSYASATI